MPRGLGHSYLVLPARVSRLRLSVGSLTRCSSLGFFVEDIVQHVSESFACRRSMREERSRQDSEQACPIRLGESLVPFASKRAGRLLGELDGRVGGESHLVGTDTADQQEDGRGKGKPDDGKPEGPIPAGRVSGAVLRSLFGPEARTCIALFLEQPDDARNRRRYDAESLSSCVCKWAESRG